MNIKYFNFQILIKITISIILLYGTKDFQTNLTPQEINYNCWLGPRSGQRFSDYQLKEYEWENFLILTQYGYLLKNASNHKLFKRFPLKSGDIILSINNCELDSSSLKKNNLLHKLLVSFLYPDDRRIGTAKIKLIRDFDLIIITGKKFEKIEILQKSFIPNPIPIKNTVTKIKGSYFMVDAPPHKLNINFNSNQLYLRVTPFNNNEIINLGPYTLICGSEPQNQCECMGYSDKNIFINYCNPNLIWINSKDFKFNGAYAPRKY